MNRIFRRFARKVESKIVHGGNVEVRASDGPVRGYMDEAILAGKAGMLLRGWHAPNGVRIEALAAVNKTSGKHVTLSLNDTRMPRRDVTEAIGASASDGTDNHGFLLFVPLDVGESADDKWHLDYALSDGTTAWLPFTPHKCKDPVAGIRNALADLRPTVHDLATVFETTVGPCVEALWAARCAAPAKARTTRFGAPPSEPAVSVIVPLYGRVDFLRHQIAAFSNDPDFHGPSAVAELVYVLDDPRLESELLALARVVDTGYGVPFRLVTQDRNTGFSGANNAGAQVAAGEFLLLLNSDVLPVSPGWLSRLVATARDLPDFGALGCRLLYEDGSIQHAGMSFRPSPMVAGAWENVHPLKGYPACFDEAGGPVQMPAVTAACMLLDREVYERLGGLAEDYIVGDYEDSDLCLKLLRDGLKIWYTPDVELYHLERQSINGLGDAGWRQNLTFYNMWRHGRRWGGEIESALASAGNRPTAATGVRAAS